MSELDVVSEFNQDKMQTTGQGNSLFRLPKIKNVHSRASVRSRPDKNPNKSPKNRYNLKSNNSDVKDQEEHVNKIQLGRHFDQERFNIDIEKKLKHVLEKVNPGEPLELVQDIESDQDFEEIIKHNKLKLKQQKHDPKNRIRTKADVQVDSKRDSPPKHRIAKAGNRPNAIFKKKGKQYAEKLENQFLEKKKELLAQNQELDRAKSIGKKIQRRQSHKQKEQKEPKNVRKQRSMKNVPKKRISTNVFDNIHTILEGSKEKLNDDVVKVPKKKMEELQIKIKQLNQKLGIKQHLKTKQTEILLTQNATVRDWRRLEYQGAKISCRNNSNFDEQMQRVQKLQQNNNQTLDNYVEHQKILVELGYLKKIYPKIDSNTK